MVWINSPEEIPFGISEHGIDHIMLHGACALKNPEKLLLACSTYVFFSGITCIILLVSQGLFFLLGSVVFGIHISIIFENVLLH